MAAQSALGARHRNHIMAVIEALERHVVEMTRPASWLISWFCSGLPAEPHNMQETQPSTSVPSSAICRRRM